MSHILQQYLTLNISGNPISKNQIIDALPPGWKNTFEEIITSFYIPLGVTIVGVAIRDGVLYITQSPHGLVNVRVTNYVIRSLLQDSAKTCMMCGRHARRRKEQAHKPALCRDHYLEYINALEE